MPIDINIVNNRNIAEKIFRESYPHIKDEISDQIMKRQVLSYTVELDSEKESSSWEKEYGQDILEKIKSKSYIYFSRLNEGKVIVDVIVRNTGTIRKAIANEEKSVNDLDLQKLALKAIRRVGPFGKFPREAAERETVFTFAVDFKLEDVKSDRESKSKTGTLPSPISDLPLAP